MMCDYAHPHIRPPPPPEHLAARVVPTRNDPLRKTPATKAPAGFSRKNGCSFRAG